MLSEVHGGEATKLSRVFEWHKWPKKARMSKSQMNKTLITFFNIKYTVHFEFIPQRQTVSEAYYVKIFEQLC
jgi:hypothetical protein